MCGIAGFIDPGSAPHARVTAVDRMCAALHHRGPDDGGSAGFADGTLGARRLAIFDPAHGRQPMTSPDGKLTIVFNGAIYNFRTLRTELAHTGWAFRTACDTEVLLAAYARWGAKCLDRLRGMYAFAVWDDTARALFLARDPFGIKPLYYHHNGRRLAFASELNALRASGVVPCEIDPASAADYLGWLAVPAPRTIYRDVFSLRPGECATFADGQLSVRTAWDFRRAGEGARPCATLEDFTRGLRTQLEDTIRAHMLADVPVGAFLSGGLDSAAIVALMTRISGQRLRTFSIGFAEHEYSEADHAAATARHLGTDHHAHVLTGAQLAADIDTLIGALDQPTGDGVNTYYASRAARLGGVTVALSGLGGDELFGGYPSFRDVPRLARWLPLWRALPSGLCEWVVRRMAGTDTRGAKLGDLLRHARDEASLAALYRRVFTLEKAQALLSPDARAAGGGRPPHHPELGALRDELAPAGHFERLSAWELRTYMADVLLRDSDVMSMQHSLELRVPFVDRPLVDWLWQQPAAFKHTPRHPKSALAEAVADLLPTEVLQRPKRGFTLPLAGWMKRELKPFLEDVFSSASVSRSGLFSEADIQALWRGFLAGDDAREWSRVWSLAMLIAFCNRPPLSPSGTAADRAPFGAAAP